MNTIKTDENAVANPRLRTGGHVQVIDVAVKPLTLAPAAAPTKTLKLPPLTNARNVRRAIGRLANWILTGQLDSADAARIGFMLTVVNKSLEIEQDARIEAQLARIEERHGHGQEHSAAGQLDDEVPQS